MTSPQRVLAADSSALVKLVIEEAESEALALEIDRQPTTLVVSRVAVIEVIRAVSIVEPLQLDEADRLLRSCVLISVSDAIIGLARTLTSERLRTLDAIHLATAMLAGAEAMAVYETRLGEAAAAHGLTAIAPGT